MSALGYIMIFGLLGAFGASVVWALWWAIRGGQMSDFQRGATSIFDRDEPVGRPTDAFPGARPAPRGGTGSGQPVDQQRTDRTS